MSDKAQPRPAVNGHNQNFSRKHNHLAATSNWRAVR
jgi:hypothetical protein